MSKKNLKLSLSDIKKHIKSVISEQKDGRVSDSTAEGLWNDSKDRLDFKIKMNQKGYSDQDVLFWTKKYETSYGKKPGDKTSTTSGGGSRQNTTRQNTTKLVDVSGTNKGEGVNFYADPMKNVLVFTYTIDRIERDWNMVGFYKIFFKELKNKYFMYRCSRRQNVPFPLYNENDTPVYNRGSRQIYQLFSPDLSREFETNYCKVNPNGQPVPKVKFASNNTNQSKPTDTLAENKKIKNQKTNNMKVKKVVRLTESELKKYIQKIISEQSTPASKPVIPNDIPRTADSMKQLQDLVGKTVSIICDSMAMGCIITEVNQDERGVAYIFVNNKADSKRNLIEFNPIKDTINFIDRNHNNIGDIFKGEFYGWLKKNVKSRERKFDFNSQNIKSPIKNNGSQV